MVAGGDVNDSETIGIVWEASHVNNVHGVIDRVFSLVEKDKGAGRSRVDEIGFFTIDTPRPARIGPPHGLSLAAPSNPIQHGHAPYAGFDLTIDSDRALVSGTFEDLGTPADVGPDDALGEVGFGVPVFSIGSVEIEPASHPLMGTVLHEGEIPAAIVDVKLPGDQELPMIIHAHDTMGLGLGLTERWQQHAGENCDDRDHDKQLDECEPSGGRIVGNYSHLPIL